MLEAVAEERSTTTVQPGPTIVREEEDSVRRIHMERKLETEPT